MCIRDRQLQTNDGLVNVKVMKFDSQSNGNFPAYKTNPIMTPHNKTNGNLTALLSSNNVSHVETVSSVDKPPPRIIKSGLAIPEAIILNNNNTNNNNHRTNESS